MISEVLTFLKDRLNNILSAKSGIETGDSGEDKVVFVDGEKMDPITFKLGAVSVLLINIEEENTFRRPDRYSVVTQDGSRQKVQPEIRMNLYILFIARFKQYEQGLKYLSRIISYFQNHQVLNQHNSPELVKGLGPLHMELITLPFSEQNEMWNSLRTTYHPSVLYRVRTVVFADEDAMPQPELQESNIGISQ